MEIKIKGYYWDKEYRKILGQFTRTLSEDDICNIILKEYETEEFNPPMYLSREDIELEVNIDEIKI